MRKANQTSFKSGKSGNPGGMTKEQRQTASDFRNWCFDLFYKNKDSFKSTILTDEDTQMKFLKMLSDMVPKEIDLGNKEGQVFKISVE